MISFPTRTSKVRSFLPALWVGVLFLFALLSANSAEAIRIEQRFDTSTAAGWVLGGSAKLTSGNGDPVGDGWLQLTDRTSNDQFGYAYYTTPFEAPLGFFIELEYLSWGGSGADGFTVFLFNGANTNFNIGDAGGSLGYANGCNGVPGLSEGYMGVAFDEFGNFSAQEAGTRCKQDGPGRYANSITVRGAAEFGYPYITHRQLPTSGDQRIDCPSSICRGTTRPTPSTYYRQARLVMIPETGTGYRVSVEGRPSPIHDYEVLLPEVLVPCPGYPTLKLGFAASTGGSTNAHELRNVVVEVFESHTDHALTGGFTRSLFGGSTTQFRADVMNHGPYGDAGPIKVTFDLPNGLTYTGVEMGSPWTCSYESGDLVCAYHGGIEVNQILPSLVANFDISSSVAGQTLVTKARVSGNAFDINPTNDTVLTSRFVYGAPASGTKNLYAYFRNSGTGSTALPLPPSGHRNTLQRRRPGTGGMPQSNTGQISGGGSNATDWMTLTPSVTENIAIPAGEEIEVSLCIRRAGTVTTRNARVEVRLQNNPSDVRSVARSVTLLTTTRGVMETFGIPMPTGWVITPNNPLQMRVVNTESTRSRNIRLYSSYNGCGTGAYSRVDFYTTNVINVEKVEIHSAPYPAEAEISTTSAVGSTVYVRSVVSDPFGSFDINQAQLEVYDRNENLILAPANMNVVDEDVATGSKVFELAVTVPTWENSVYTYNVVAHEGIEDRISHSLATDLEVLPPAPFLSVTKLASSSPELGGNERVNPGSEVSYVVKVSNTGLGDAIGVDLKDALPKFLSLGLNSYGSDQPFSFVDGSPASNLTLGEVQFSADGGESWNYSPLSGAGGAPVGHDARVTHFKIPMIGTMPPGSSFSLHYKTRLD